MRETIKRQLSRYPGIYRAVRTTRDFLRPPDEDPVKRELRRLLRWKRGLFFIQIGSNDGVQGDPIHDLIVRRKDWRGILVEPVRFVFDRLRRNYGHSADRIVFENVAVSTRREKREFYYVSEKAKALFAGELPFWYDQLGSFEKQHILKHLNGALEPYIVTEPVTCVLLEDILVRNNVQRIDLLHIDAEGFDYSVLRQVDLDRYRPLVILFEHEHLPDDEKRDAAMLLTRHGYELRRFGGDTLAVLRSRDAIRWIADLVGRARGRGGSALQQAALGLSFLVAFF